MDSFFDAHDIPYLIHMDISGSDVNMGTTSIHFDTVEPSRGARMPVKRIFAILPLVWLLMAIPAFADSPATMPMDRFAGKWEIYGAQDRCVVNLTLMRDESGNRMKIENNDDCDIKEVRYAKFWASGAHTDIINFYNVEPYRLMLHAEKKSNGKFISKDNVVVMKMVGGPSLFEYARRWFMSKF